MEEIVKHINDTNASFRSIGSGDAKNTDLFLDNEHYELFREAGEQITVRFNKENLQKAILFIASILPRKYDNSAIHKTVSFSSEFVLEQLAFLDAYFTVDGTKVDSRTQTWNARKDVMKKNGEIDSRFYFNGLLEEVAYNFNGEQKSAKFTIRNYLAGGYSDLHIKKAEDGIFDVWVTNTLEYHDDGKDCSYEIIDSSHTSQSLQQIFYGAPGTGKSYAIEVATEGQDVIRTTFHPDSDYSTFVGAYKPTTKEIPVISTFGGKAVKVLDEKGNEITEERIIYEFVSQAFLQAYVGAWEKYATNGDSPQAQYLVIEEINRGNCAQIFGDLFQLLDRNPDGFSEYPIKADADMKKQLKKQLAGITIENPDSINALYKGKDVVTDVLAGEILLLPNNLYIWATMNTSDQSLFPIDSAFKRRWDWKYVRIDDARKGWRIQAKGKKYDWWDFLEKINRIIGDTTSSEDKKLGYFFCKTADGIISAETFVSKVVFYLWNDVFKDYEFEGDIFVDEDKTSKLSFDKFYITDANGQTVANEAKVDLFLTNLGVEFDKPEGISDENGENDDEADVTDDGYKESINRIEFPDGTAITTENLTQFDAFIEAMKKIGLEKVFTVADKLKYQRRNCPMLSLEKFEAIENDPGYSYVQVDNYYFVKGAKSYTYVRIIEDLSKMLDLNISVICKKPE